MLTAFKPTPGWKYPKKDLSTQAREKSSYSVAQEIPAYFTASSNTVTYVEVIIAATPGHPTARLKTYGDRAFSVVVPKLWNTLPLELRLSDIFKKRLKTYLFKMPFNL